MKGKKSNLVYSTDSETLRKILEQNEKDSVAEDFPPEKQSVHIFLQTKGRKGKKVTVASGFKHAPDKMKLLAKELKQACGAGGTVKNDVIEIQGDKRRQVAQFLLQRNYRVKGA